MKNKKNKQVIQQQQQPVKLIGISKRGRKVIYAGLAVLALGYFVLTRTDPAGQNWASKLSPFLIIGGYTCVGIGIVVPEKTSLPAPR